tara:strand:- start:134 stop:1018 length:885 start_codon:yes stop_codon:yes gene_type:complete
MSQISELENRITLLQNLINLSKEAKDMSSQIRSLQATGRARINLPYDEKISMAKELDIKKDSLYNKIGNLQGAVGINNYLGNALNKDGTPKNSPVGIGTYQTFLIRAQSELNQIKTQQKIDMEVNPLQKEILEIRNQQNTLQSNLKMIEATTRKFDGTFVPYTIELQKSTSKKIKELEIQLQKTQTISQIQIQDVTFNEQVNSGDFNETPITDINVSGGCSECSTTKDQIDPILEKEGYHKMPDGSLMKDTDMDKVGEMSIDPIPEKELKEGYMKMAGIAAVAIGLGYLILKNK